MSQFKKEENKLLVIVKKYMIWKALHAVLTFHTFIIKTIPIFLIEYYMYFVLVDITQKMSFMFLKDLQNPYYDHRLKEPCGS